MFVHVCGEGKQAGGGTGGGNGSNCEAPLDRKRKRNGADRGRKRGGETVNLKKGETVTKRRETVENGSIVSPGH